MIRRVVEIHTAELDGLLVVQSGNKVAIDMRSFDG